MNWQNREKQLNRDYYWYIGSYLLYGLVCGALGFLIGVMVCT